MIEINDLRCSFGDVQALAGLSLRVERGDVFGFIGPNGAGKTTTLKILATLQRPTGGDAWIGGVNVVKSPEQVRRTIGYVPDHFGLYPDMLVVEYLDFFGAAYRMEDSKRRQVVKDVLALTDLAGKSGDRIAALSRGMQQRLALARSLLHDPQVLLLDEPASGLDPRARVEMRALVQELGRMGKTVLLSSHILWEMGTLCNKIGIVDRGKLVFSGTIEQARRAAFGGLTVSVVLHARPEEACRTLAAIDGVSSVERDGDRLLAVLREGVEDASPVARALARGGFPVLSYCEEELDLEAIFRRMMMARQGVREVLEESAADAVQRDGDPASERG